MKNRLSVPSRLLTNYSQTPQRVTPQAVTFQQLCLAILLTIRQTAPGFVLTRPIILRIHDLFNLCPPDLSREGARWLLPRVTQQLARELAQEVSAPILKGEI